MTGTADITPWWEIVTLRPEVVGVDGAVTDVQMSLYHAALPPERMGPESVPYASATYYGEITHPAGSLVDFMARIAVRLGVPGSTQTSGVWRLDQGMGGGKSHGLIGLWHLAKYPGQLVATDLGREVMKVASDMVGAGKIRPDLGSPVCVVLDCDNTTADTEDYGPAHRLGERFLWRLFEMDYARYTDYKDHLENKAKLAEALRSVGRPVLVLIDEIMDYIRAEDARDPAGAVRDMAFLRAFLEAAKTTPNCVVVLVMIASDKDRMVMTTAGYPHRRELAGLLERNGITTAVTSGGDFAEILQRRLFQNKPSGNDIESVVRQFLAGMSGAWRTRVFDKAPGNYTPQGFRQRVARAYPFHPDLMDLAENEWSQNTGFQVVRSTIRVFASAVYEQARLAATGQWVPQLIDSGDLPLQSSVVRESLLQSGVVPNERTVVSLRQVAATDIIDPHNPQRGAARRLDSVRTDEWVPHNPRAAERMATALFVRSLCPRPGAVHGATEAELHAASFAPSASYTPGDAEAVCTELLEEPDEGLAAIDFTPGKNKSVPKRWRFETRNTLPMLRRAEKQTITDMERDDAIAECTNEIAQRLSKGPFNRVITVTGDEPPRRRPTTEACLNVLREASIDIKRQTRLVVLDPRWFSLYNGDDTATREAVTAALGLGSSAIAAAEWSSSAVFACANTSLRGQARNLAAQWLACQRVAALPVVQGDQDMAERAQNDEKTAREELEAKIRLCYRYVIYLAPDGEHGRQVDFHRIRNDSRTGLSGNDVWHELQELRKTFGPNQFNKRALLHNLGGNDDGRPLPEIRDSFWNNPHKPLLPSGATELREAIYHAVTSGDIELYRNHRRSIRYPNQERRSHHIPRHPTSPSAMHYLPQARLPMRRTHTDITHPPARPGANARPRADPNTPATCTETVGYNAEYRYCHR